MSNLFDESVINNDAIEQLSDEQADEILAILKGAGY